MEECDINLIAKAEAAAAALMQKLKMHSLTLALSESCTAGLVSALLAGVPGASEVLWGSFVCYTKEAKVSMLNLDHDKLAANGLVSAETASSMAMGALEKSGACLAAAVTGIAGPGGDGSNVPVGTVWTAAARRNGETIVKEFHFTGSRQEVRLNAALAVFETVNFFLT